MAGLATADSSGSFGWGPYLVVIFVTAVVIVAESESKMKRTSLLCLKETNERPNFDTYHHTYVRVLLRDGKVR